MIQENRSDFTREDDVGTDLERQVGAFWGDESLSS